MSTRAHTSECLKTKALRIQEDTGISACVHECTCGAVYEPGVEERLEHARHDRETLERLENAFEAVGGDLVDEVLALREASRKAVAVLTEAGGSPFRKLGDARCLLEDALAREDGQDA